MNVRALPKYRIFSPFWLAADQFPRIFPNSLNCSKVRDGHRKKASRWWKGRDTFINQIISTKMQWCLSHWEILWELSERYSPWRPWIAGNGKDNIRFSLFILILTNDIWIRCKMNPSVLREIAFTALTIENNPVNLNDVHPQTGKLYQTMLDDSFLMRYRSVVNIIKHKMIGCKRRSPQFK